MTFLEHVAEDLLRQYGHDLSRIAVVFPNKRASIFLNEALEKNAERPIWSPAYVTISDLFRQHSPLQVADPVKLVCDLHKVYGACTGQVESLDKFYGWGQVLLADFDDIDKHLANADEVFFNIAAYHELDDNSYLDEDQKEVLKRFFANFDDSHETRLKEKFLTLWSRLGDIYHQFNDRLAAQGLAYEGQLYRQVVESGDIDFRHDRYLFVGFNMMQEVEQRLADRLKAKGMAAFYWDYDRAYTQQRQVGRARVVPEAGVFVNQLRQKYPNALDEADDAIFDNLRKDKCITFGSAPTEDIQARYVAQWLLEDDRYKDGVRTAVVLADENLLQTVVHCLPEAVTDANVTTGWPLSQSPFTSLIVQLLQLQTTGSRHSDFYRQRFLNKVRRHPYAQFFSDGSLKRLQKDDALSLTANLLDILKEIGVNSLADDDGTEAPRTGMGGQTSIFFRESLFQTYTLVNRLHGLILSGDLDIDTVTLQRLYLQLAASTSIPFHGEPAVGVQVMGILETRNLDFDHVLVLSCGEGNMPKGAGDASLIPYSIRKAFGLTTIDNKTAIYAYYFYSLLQRAKDATLLYNNSTEDGHTGEMSRFMLQLMVERKGKVNRIKLHSGRMVGRQVPTAIKKEGRVADALDHIDSLTPTAINNYLRCQLRFYYRYIACIEEPDRADEGEIDNAVFGNIFHRAAELVYKPFEGKPTVSRDDIDRLLKDDHTIQAAVDQAFKEKFFKNDSPRFRPEYNGLQIINRNVIIVYIKQLLAIDRTLAPFTILALEHWVETSLQVATPAGTRTVRTGGIIDRLDKVNDKNGERIRVVDYKTGSRANNTITSIEEIFTGENIRQHHTDYFLQTLLYALIVRNSKAENATALPVSPALLYIQHAKAKDYDPTLVFGKRPLADCLDVEDKYREGIEATIADLFDPGKPFAPTADRTRCDTCPYKQLCHTGKGEPQETRVKEKSE